MKKKYAVYQITEHSRNIHSLVRMDIDTEKEAIEVMNSFVGGLFIIQEYWSRQYIDA